MVARPQSSGPLVRGCNDGHLRLCTIRPNCRSMDGKTVLSSELFLIPSSSKIPTGAIGKCNGCLRHHENTSTN